MGFCNQTVENPKNENEKPAQKRQFYHFALQKFLAFGTEFGCKKDYCDRPWPRW